MKGKIAVVTGANKGIGLEVCRQLAKAGIQVILTSRDESKGQTATETLKSEGLEVIYYALDVTEADSIARLEQFIRDRFGHLDILVNNAGILLDSSGAEDSLFKAQLDTIRTAMETNLYGPLRLCQALVPLMQIHNYGRVVNVSSGVAQLSGMDKMGGIYPSYRLSKTGLNALTRMLAYELRQTNILVNCVCPGWVKTDMGGTNATRTVAAGADTIVWLATLPDGSPSGLYWRDRKPLDW